MKDLFYATVSCLVAYLFYNYGYEANLNDLQKLSEQHQAVVESCGFLGENI